jgi:hypothetical protein
VDVVGLYREVNDAKPVSDGTPDTAPDLAIHYLFAQARQPPTGAERDVNGVVFFVLGPRAMRDVTTTRRALSPGAIALAASGS